MAARPRFFLDVPSVGRPCSQVQSTPSHAGWFSPVGIAAAGPALDCNAGHCQLQVSMCNMTHTPQLAVCLVFMRTMLCYNCICANSSSSPTPSMACHQ